MNIPLDPSQGAAFLIAALLMPVILYAAVWLFGLAVRITGLLIGA